MSKVIRTPLVFLFAAILFGAAGAQASPLGTDYFPILDLADLGGVLESHFAPGPIIFDGAPTPIPEMFPGLGSGVVLTEMVTPGPGFDVIEFWWENMVPGDPLFDTPLAPDQAIFTIFDGLYWGPGSPGAIVTVVDVVLTFTAGGAPPLHLTELDYFPGVFGFGTEIDAIIVDIDIPDIASLLAGLEISDDITDLHVTLHATHVPLPAGLPLLAAGLFAVFRFSGRRRAHTLRSQYPY